MDQLFQRNHRRGPRLQSRPECIRNRRPRIRLDFQCPILWREATALGCLQYVHGAVLQSDARFRLVTGDVLERSRRRRCRNDHRGKWLGRSNDVVLRHGRRYAHPFVPKEPHRWLRRDRWCVSTGHRAGLPNGDTNRFPLGSGPDTAPLWIERIGASVETERAGLVDYWTRTNKWSSRYGEAKSPFLKRRNSIFHRPT